MAKIAPPSHPGLPSDLEVQLYVPDGQEGYRADAKATVLEAMLYQMKEHKMRTVKAPIWNVSKAVVAGYSSADDASGPLEFLEPARRPDKVTVVREALPVDFASQIAAALRAAPESAWEKLSSDAATQEALKRSQDRQQVKIAGEQTSKLQRMRYSTLQDGYDVFDREEVGRRVGEALGLQAHERLLLNFARYAPGDFLDSHTDRPSGNAAYERQRAWVWHLSTPGWGASRGGAFVDEDDSDRKYIPTFNNVVHFPVPRWHRVEPVIVDAKTGASEPRYTAYGWIVTAEVMPVASIPELVRLQKSGPVSVVGWFGVWPARRPHSKQYCIDLAGCCLGRIGVDRIRGEYARFACATSAAVAEALGLMLPPPSDGAPPPLTVGVVRWGISRVDVLHLPIPDRVKALGTFVDEHRGAAGVPTLDCDDHPAMIEMYASMDVKLYVIVPPLDHESYAAALADSHAQHAKLIKIYLCDPAKIKAIMDEVKITPEDAPTALAHDVHGIHSIPQGKEKWWRHERADVRAANGKGSTMTPDSFTSFITRVASELRPVRFTSGSRG